MLAHAVFRDSHAGIYSHRNEFMLAHAVFRDSHAGIYSTCRNLNSIERDRIFQNGMFRAIQNGMLQAKDEKTAGSVHTACSKYSMFR
jgi:hypothetical protein